MNRDALMHFEEHVVKPKSLEALLALEQYYQLNRDELAADFQVSLAKIGSRIAIMQKNEVKGSIAYITYSMLRTGLMLGEPKYLIEAADQRWFLDPVECNEYYDAEWAFRYWSELGDKLNDARLEYRGAVQRWDIDAILRKEATKFNQYIVSLARYATRNQKLSDTLPFEMGEQIEIRVGEYIDHSEAVYIEDFRLRDSLAIRTWLEQKEEPGTYAYKAIMGVNLSDGDYEGLDLRYSNLCESDLSMSLLRGCILVGSNFRDGRLDGANLEKSLVYEADFRRCSLKKAVLRGIEGASGLPDPSVWEMPGFVPVSFEEADLRHADLEGVDLRGASFIGARLEGTRFSGALLHGAIFSEKDRDHLELDDVQRRSVVWVNESGAKVGS
jgi:BTB/POZ domain-containing protein KCTD9